MGRKKNFSRAGVLEKAIPLFWERGYAGTSLHDLELATGVNKSGLYTEFKDKQALFVACLERYLRHRLANGGLAVHPQGLSNIERFLRQACACEGALRGCFSVNSLRELAILPPEAGQVMAHFQARLRELLIANMPGGRRFEPDGVADMIQVFFFGLCMEQQLHADQVLTSVRIDNFMRMLLDIVDDRSYI